MYIYVKRELHMFYHGISLYNQGKRRCKGEALTKPVKHVTRILVRVKTPRVI